MNNHNYNDRFSVIGQIIHATTLYRTNGFAVFQSCGRHGERKLVLRFSTVVYESDTLFTLVCNKYWSYLQIVSE